MLTISEWADDKRRLSSEASAEPGRWRTDRAIYKRGIMDAIGDPAIESVVVMSSSQTGKSECCLNAVGFHIDQDPAPIMVVMPTERDAKTWSKDRFSPMARDTPYLNGRISDPKSRDGSNKILHKTFPAASCRSSAPTRRRVLPAGRSASCCATRWTATRSAPAPRAIRSTSPGSGRSRSGTGRSSSSRRRPSGAQAGSRRPSPKATGAASSCPAPPAASTRRWPGRRSAGTGIPTAPIGQRARYECGHCDAPWSDAERWAAVRKGAWRAEAPFDGIAGFHLNEIYSSWVRLEAMVRTFLSAKDHGDEALKTFVNTSLGETWVESGEAPDWQRLYDRREAWAPGTVPAGGLFLTAGADVQKDRLEVDVWAWGRGLESWLVDHIVIEGGPENAATWSALDLLLGRTWRHSSGTAMALARLAIDTGYEAPAIYAWARRAGFAQVAPVKGAEGFNRASPVSGPTYVDATDGGKRLRRGARLWSVLVSTFKAETFRHLRLLPTRADGEWCKQFVAEQLVTVKTKRGFTRLEWQKLRERNEALDCRVYARAAAWIAGADRWGEDKWRDLERQVGTIDPPDRVMPAPPPSDGEASAAAPAGLVRRAPAHRGRRVFTPSYLR